MGMVAPSISISDNANVGTTNFGTNFDHLGLEVFHLTPEEEKLSLLAYEISAKKLNQLGISHVKLNQQGISPVLGEKETEKERTIHHRIKRGGYKKKGKKKKKKTVHKCASSSSVVFAFFAFITLNINVRVDIMMPV